MFPPSLLFKEDVMTRAEKEVRNEKMRRYKAEGHTMKEVAEHFSVSLSIAQAKCKGIAPQKPIVIPTNKGIIKGDDDVAYFIAERLKGFEYVGSYTGTDGRADIRCKACGTVTTRSMISIRHSSVKCRECERVASEQKEAKKEKKQKFARAKKKARAESNRFNKAYSIEFKFCPVCGKHFVTDNHSKIYCSDDCCRTVNNYNRGSRDRLNKENTTDKDISLKRLYDIEQGVCYLCGGQCDWNDNTTQDNGVFIAGNNYPSIDHVVPLSRGGLHSWDNVRLAHRLCNSIKWANI